MNYTNDLKIDISQLNEQLRRLKSGINDASKAFKNSVSAIKDWTNNANGINLKIKEQKEILEKNNKVLDILYDKYQTLSKDKNVSFSTLKSLNDEIEKQKAIVNQNTIAIADYQEQLKKLATFDATDIAASLNEKVSVLAKNIANNLGNAIKNTIKNSISEGLNFENAFAGVRKVTDGTEEQLKELETQIRQTSLEKPISQEQLASIYQMGSQLGIARNDLKDFSDTIIDLAKTSNLTEEAGASMLAQYANVMHLTPDEYRRFASTLSYLGSKTATTENDIMNLASRISGTASILGMTHKDLLALSTAMGSVGISAESGGSAISTIMQNIDKQLATNGKNVQTWAEVAGMSVKDFSNLWKTDLMSAIQRIMTGMADAKKGGENLNVILKELGVSNIRQITTMQKLASASELLNDCIDKANTEWERNTFLTNSSNEIYNTLGSQMQLLSNSFTEIKLSIFENLKEPMQDAFKAINDLIKSPEIKNAINNFAKQLGNVIKTFFGNAEKLKATLKTIGTILTAIMAGAFFTKGVLIVANIINVYNRLKTAIEAAKVAQTALNLAMNANVVGAIVTIIFTLVGALVAFAMNLNNATDKTKEHTKALEEQKDQLIANRVEREKTIAGIDAEANHTQSLVNELKTLVDENGKVKDGQQDRINTILPLIQNATGVEIECINGQITKYNELIGTLDQVIAKKRLEAKINAYQGDYEEAIRGIEGLEDELKDKKDNIVRLEHEINERLKFQEAKALAGEGRSLYTYANETLRLQNKLAEYKKQRDDLIASKSEFDKTINKYEGLITEQYNTFGNGSKTTTNAEGAFNAGSAAGQAYVQGFSSTSNGVVNEVNATGKKVKEETKTTYQELLNQEKACGDQLKSYLEEVKKGNSQVTVEMVQDTKKKLDEVQKKVKDMKQLLGNNIVNSKIDLDDEASEAFDDANTNHISKGVIFGKGVIAENAIEMEGVGKEAATAYLSGYIKQQEDNQYVLQESATTRANQEAIAYQGATLAPENLEIYNQTEYMLANSKQTSQAEGLQENAYKVINAETWTLKQAINAAKTIDFTVVGKYICDGIAAGILGNKQVVINAVRTVMAEAQAAADKENDSHSPSRVYYKKGMFIDLGLANGIKDYANVVNDEMRRVQMGLKNSLNLANDAIELKQLKQSQLAFKGAGNTEVTYNFTQNNTSNKSLDTLTIYHESKSLLKRAVKNRYV